MKTSNVLIGTALTAAIGYAIADGLARACTYAEEVEDNEFCRTPSADGAAAASSAPPGAARAAAGP